MKETQILNSLQKLIFAAHKRVSTMSSNVYSICCEGSSRKSDESVDNDCVNVFFTVEMNVERGFGWETEKQTAQLLSSIVRARGSWLQLMWFTICDSNFVFHSRLVFLKCDLRAINSESAWSSEHSYVFKNRCSSHMNVCCFDRSRY